MGGKQTAMTRTDVLVLRCRLKNVSAGQVFNPMEAWRPAACRVEDNYGNRLTPLADTWPFKKRYSFEGQIIRELKPGEAMETIILSEPSKVDTATKFTWTLYFKSSNKERFNRIEKGPPFVLEFTKSDIRRSPGKEDTSSQKSIQKRTDPLKATDGQIIKAYYGDGGYARMLRIWKRTDPLEYYRHVNSAREYIATRGLTLEEYQREREEDARKVAVEEELTRKKREEGKQRTEAERKALAEHNKQLEQASAALVKVEQETTAPDQRKALAKEALSILDKALTKRDDPSARALRSLALVHLGKLEDSKRELQVAAKRSPKGKLWRRALSHLVVNLPADDALALLEKLQEQKLLGREEALRHTALGYIGLKFYAAGDMEKALACLEVAGKSHENMRRRAIVLGLFRARVACGKYGEAFRLAGASVTGHSKHFNTAKLCLEVARVADKAIAIHDKVTGYGQLDLMRLTQDWAQQALKLDPKCAEAMFLVVKMEDLMPRRYLGKKELQLLRKARDLGYQLPPKYAKMVGGNRPRRK